MKKICQFWFLKILTFIFKLFFFLVKGVDEKKLIMEQNLFIVKEVTASIQSISKSLLEKCNDLEQAIVGVSSIRNEQLAKVMIEQAIKQTLESFESTKKDVEDNRVILAKLLPEENRNNDVQPITFLKEAEEEEESSESEPPLLESDSESFFLFEEEEEELNRCWKNAMIWSKLLLEYLQLETNN